MLRLVSDPAKDDAQVRELRRRLDEFYSRTTDYYAFQAPPDNSWWFDLMAPLVREVCDRAAKEGRPARILELGAGLPTFPKHFAEMKDRFEYHAQDVTAQNREYLDQMATQVFIADVEGIPGPYDLIFSTFVFEHVSNPTAFLHEIKRLLTPGGVHVIFCPRYDLPGYLCPSLRHLRPLNKLAALLFLSASRLVAHIDRRARFWVNLDPAVLHLPWFRDSDAVHVVSRYDVERWHKKNGFVVNRIDPRPLLAVRRGWRIQVLLRHLTLMLACRKSGTA